MYGDLTFSSWRLAFSYSWYFLFLCMSLYFYHMYINPQTIKCYFECFFVSYIKISCVSSFKLIFLHLCLEHHGFNNLLFLSLEVMITKNFYTKMPHLLIFFFTSFPFYFCCHSLSSNVNKEKIMRKQHDLSLILFICFQLQQF